MSKKCHQLHQRLLPWKDSDGQLSILEKAPSLTKNSYERKSSGSIGEKSKIIKKDCPSIQEVPSVFYLPNWFKYYRRGSPYGCKYVHCFFLFLWGWPVCYRDWGKCAILLCITDLLYWNYFPEFNHRESFSLLAKAEDVLIELKDSPLKYNIIQKLLHSNYRQQMEWDTLVM